MKIDSENLRWYAAFHNESYHPHVHVMVYSAKDHDGFLTEPAIEAMRSELAHDIFRQDFANLYGVQNAAREGLKKEAEQTVKRLIQEIQSGTCQNQKIEKQIHLLSKRLQRTNGKKVYGYLKADLKQMVDRIVDELEQEPHIKELYQSWGIAREKIWQTYSDQPIPLASLSQQNELKRIKNMVITEAMQIGSHHFLLEESSAEENDIWIDGAVTETESVAGDERIGESERRDVVEEPEDNDALADVLDAIAELLKMNGEAPLASMKGYLSVATIPELESVELDVKSAMQTVLKDMESLRTQAFFIREQADKENQFDVVAHMEDDVANYNKTIWFIQSMLK